MWRFDTGTWWSGLVLRTVGFLMIGKTGFKVALAVVFAGAVLIASLRRRRQRASEQRLDDPSAAG